MQKIEGKEIRVRVAKASVMPSPSVMRNFAWVSVVVTVAFGIPRFAFATAAEFVEAVSGGVAANIDAASPMIGAGILAKADVDIAQTYSDAMKYMANVTAQTSMYQAASAAAVAVAQGLSAYKIFQTQEAGVNYRLDRQLTELRDARKDALNFQLAGLQKQWQFQERYLDILAIQNRNNYRIAKLAMQLQKTALGFQDVGAPGFTVTTSPALAGFGATGTPATLQVATRPRPVATAATVVAAARYPGRPHAASSHAVAIRPLSTHAAY